MQDKNNIPGQKENSTPSAPESNSATISGEGATTTSENPGVVGQISNDMSFAGDSLSNLQQQTDGIVANPDLSAGDKALAIGVVAAQTFQDVKGAVDSIKSTLDVVGNITAKVDGAVTAVLAKLSFLRGIACLPIVKQMDPVLGLDVHFVIIPPAPAVPMPHPYIGIMFRTKDFVACALATATAYAAQFIPPPAPPVTASSSPDAIKEAAISMAANIAFQAIKGKVRSMGASVKIGPVIPRVVVGTPSKPIPHIPMGTGFSPAFIMVDKTCGYSFLGSLFVNADGDPLTGGFAHLHNDCWDLGKPPVEIMLANAAKKLFKHKPPKNSDAGASAKVQLFLPTGVMMPIPWNKPILVNPVPTPINPTAALSIFIKAGFAKLGEMLIDATKQFLIDTGLGEMLGIPNDKNKSCAFWEQVSAKIGTGSSHPADVSRGYFYTQTTDFSIKGVIPLQFKRIYYSNSGYQGALGTGWHHSYDMALAFEEKSGLAGLRLADGRLTSFEIPEKGTSSFDRNEKLWLHHHKEGHFTVSDKKGHVYRFTDKEYKGTLNKSRSHLLQSISNRNGYSIRFSYDTDGVLKEIVDTAGRIYQVSNDGLGHITQIVAPSPNRKGEPFVIAAYEYDREGRMIKQTNAEGHSMHFEYDGNMLVKETWRNGLRWYITYDKPYADAKVLEIKGDGGIYHHRFNYVASDCTIVTNSLGEKTTYFHRKGVVTKRVDPNGAENIFRYNAANELEWTQDALGNTSTAIYDEWGNLVSKTSPDGGFVQIQYENKQYPYLPTSATDKAGGKWEWLYDEQGNLVKRINPLNAETGFEYTDGLLTTLTGPLGQQTHLKYDNYNNLIETLSPDKGENVWHYDSLGRCTYYKNARGGVNEYTYDLLGNTTKAKLPDGNIRHLTYDTQGNIIVAKDNDRLVTFTYRGVNKLASRTEHGATLRFFYDTEDQLRIVENEEHEQYEFILDSQGRVTEEIGFDGLTRKYYRDQAGRVHTVKRSSGTEIKYDYDEVGRVTKVIYEDGTEESYAYRKDGLLTSAINVDAEVTLERDILGRVIKESCNGETVESKYDIANNRTNITSSLGADIEAEYNLMGDLLSLGSDGWSTGYQRDVFGLEMARSLEGGIQTRTERDTRGRVTSHNLVRNKEILSEKSYLWGTNDKLLSIISNGEETKFEYDGWGNLSKTLFEDGKVEYRNPDKSGNLFESLDRMDRKYTKGGQLIKTLDWEYKYDKEGNLIRKKDKHGATWRYEWNAAGMLSKVKRPDGKEVTFKYDALGRRIEKRFIRIVTRWVWDGNTPLHEWKEKHIRDYHADKGYFTDIEKQPVTTWLFEEGTFVPVAKIQEGTKFSILTNYMGTPEAMYNEKGQKSWSCELNSYGKVRNYEGQYKTDCPFRYQGQYEDSETGLYYNRFRYYSPEEGMYISQDPIRLLGGDNLYGYVHNPNLYVDILGLDYVYQIVDKDGKVVYYGITERDPVVRGNEHVDSGNLKDGERMQVIAKDVNHDQARTIEATKIRESIEAAGGTGSVAEQLAATDLRNKNRGRNIEDRPFDPETMGGEYELLEEPEDVEGLKNAKCPE